MGLGRTPRSGRANYSGGPGGIPQPELRAGKFGKVFLRSTLRVREQHAGAHRVRPIMSSCEATGGS